MWYLARAHTHTRMHTHMCTDTLVCGRAVAAVVRVGEVADGGGGELCGPIVQDHMGVVAGRMMGVRTSRCAAEATESPHTVAGAHTALRGRHARVVCWRRCRRTVMAQCVASGIVLYTSQQHVQRSARVR